MTNDGQVIEAQHQLIKALEGQILTLEGIQTSSKGLISCLDAIRDKQKAELELAMHLGRELAEKRE